jgi:2-dehydropantoate 2-reductase
LRIAIVGAGAVGCLIGLRLHESGQDVLLVHHDSRTVDSIRKRGVALTELSGKTIRAHVDVRTSLPSNDTSDFILLTVKAYDTENAVRRLRKVMRAGTPILSLQNGLGNIEILSRYFPKGAVLAGSTTEGALGTGPGVVTHAGRGFTWIGELREKPTERITTISDAFRHAGFKTIASKNIEGVIWSKAIVNSAINPISALAQVSNGELNRSSSLMDVAMRLVGEGIMVAKANGISPMPSPRSMLHRILVQARRNRSSMLRDIEHGRKTEIRQLNGSITSLGRRLGVNVPYNTLIWKLVQGLEDSRAHHKLEYVWNSRR